MASQPLKSVVKQVKPLISTDRAGARRRVLNLYKAFAKEIPRIVHKLSYEISEEQAMEFLRNQFLKHKNITDIRVIDMLVFKGQVEFREIFTEMQQNCHIMYKIKDTQLPPPKDFLSKFIKGVD